MANIDGSAVRASATFICKRARHVHLKQEQVPSVANKVRVRAFAEFLIAIAAAG